MYYKSDNPELSLEDHDIEGWEDVESNTADDDNNNHEHNLEDDDGGIYK